jgi:hypothetical protein
MRRRNREQRSATITVQQVRLLFQLCLPRDTSLTRNCRTKDLANSPLSQDFFESFNCGIKTALEANGSMCDIMLFCDIEKFSCFLEVSS